MKQMTSGRKLAYPIVASRAASVTAMLWVGPELASDSTTTSRALMALARRPRPGASSPAPRCGPGPVLLASEDIATPIRPCQCILCMISKLPQSLTYRARQRKQQHRAHGYHAAGGIRLARAGSRRDAVNQNGALAVK